MIRVLYGVHGIDWVLSWYSYIALTTRDSKVGSSVRIHVLLSARPGAPSRC